MRKFLASITVAAALALGAGAAAAQPAASRAATTTKPAATQPFSAFAAIQAALAGPRQFTLDDLSAALQDANSRTPPDTRHAPCWSALIVVVNTKIADPFPSGLGLAQLVQKGFDLQAAMNDQTWKDQLATGCALTVLDLGTNLNALLAKIGVSALPIPKL